MIMLVPSVIFMGMDIGIPIGIDMFIGMDISISIGVVMFMGIDIFSGLVMFIDMAVSGMVMLAGIAISILMVKLSGVIVSTGIVIFSFSAKATPKNAKRTDVIIIPLNIMFFIFSALRSLSDSFSEIEVFISFHNCNVLISQITFGQLSSSLLSNLICRHFVYNPSCRLTILASVFLYHTSQTDKA
jgi:hypothetical protein